ncbi:DUF2163 domain-containing protein [Rhizobium sp. VS19-DR104.2]|uniref:DUF2163 domain-containing protein n=1 Tax=unclassified Rhizobium TaxID=2613769 RepID=UPI001C5B5158|nr:MULTISPECIES: DUF2163 domain-containing protein [unclassified Rhizobium]MBZ5761723.1 DUF2163 domain-containing protein [Rhizobium sp. VS19-DR96]MBZ5767769.1 DUF2163 domain-containing protein [Rhizobium sp. VS19-DR129.2]MBZ5773705.1 DUF2163 domain-containing protein [Rhizobium sp. VS19-DRK62.2]MBZ5786386.1 DUF2163 domain-containing protein [Rhizobium sp. VS19-DR121]MBZ5802139.1 DUF2163 domain-containing protein [Rhizobium sp. VS19-DR181]
MRTIDPALAAHLAGDATTLCHCWRVIRRDDIVLGFTDHDHDLDFLDTRFLAASGFAASDGEEQAGLPATTSDVTGGFSSDAISEADLAAGRYDAARVEVYLVNWSAPDQHLLLKVQEIGAVTRQIGQFQAELRSLAARLSEPQGRIYNRRCDAIVGDPRCGIDLALPQYRAEGLVASVEDATRMTLTGIAGFADGYFARGSMVLLDGRNSGTAADVDSHSTSGAVTQLTLWLPLSDAPEIGTRVALTAGCDKAFTTCRAKFANTANFRGCPHMPGADFAYTYADGTSLHDGSPLFP